jgi:hypothetical protein
VNNILLITGLGKPSYSSAFSIKTNSLVVVFPKEYYFFIVTQFFSSAVQAYAVLWGPDVQKTQVGLLADDNSPMIRDIE